MNNCIEIVRFQQHRLDGGEAFNHCGQVVLTTLGPQSDVDLAIKDANTDAIAPINSR